MLHKWFSKNKKVKESKKEQEVIVRIPPSPTGNLHTGTARTALFNYLFAKKNNGKIILRFEDTDTARSTKEFEENITEGLSWLGIDYDEKYYQSKRRDIYKKYIQQLLDEDKVYISKEEVKDENSRSEVIRFRNLNKVITFHDEIRGEISFDTTELHDFVIAKSIDEPLYHIAVVIDDFEMNISHIIRGDDHISNTPRQILLQEAIGAPRPIYAHIPLILGPDKSKLSKRHGATALTSFRDQGYLPEAFINFLSLLGWNPGTDQEIFSMKELVESFDLKQIQKGGAIFNPEKLNWFNKQYIKKMDDDSFMHIFSEQVPNLKVSGEQMTKIMPLIKERIETIQDIKKLYNEGELSYFESSPEYDAEMLKWKKTETLSETKEYLEEVVRLLTPLTNFSKESIKEAVWEYAGKIGKGDVLWPFRVALSGKQQSPDPFDLAYILEKEETLQRLKNAISKIS